MLGVLSCAVTDVGNPQTKTEADVRFAGVGQDGAAAINALISTEQAELRVTRVNVADLRISGDCDAEGERFLSDGWLADFSDGLSESRRIEGLPREACTVTLTLAPNEDVPFAYQIEGDLRDGEPFEIVEERPMRIVLVPPSGTLQLLESRDSLVFVFATNRWFDDVKIPMPGVLPVDTSDFRNRFRVNFARSLSLVRDRGADGRLDDDEVADTIANATQLDEVPIPRSEQIPNSPGM